MAELIRTEIHQHTLEITFDRPKERNAFNVEMLQQLANAFTQLEDNPELRVAVILAAGKHFTLGLDLEDVAAHMRKHRSYPIHGENIVDPWAIVGRERKKPVIVAAHGFCFTLGIELMLASEIRLAAPSTRFAQMEVQRGIMPFGGATIRMPREFGWSNAMRYLLTGDVFSAEEALRLGLVQEIVEQDRLRERALELAGRVAAQAPLAVQATLANARLGAREGLAAAAERLLKITTELMDTEDAEEGVRSFVEKRAAQFKGR